MIRDAAMNGKKEQNKGPTQDRAGRERLIEKVTKDQSRYVGPDHEESSGVSRRSPKDLSASKE